MKVALITGPARGIGEGLARELHRRGYRVSLVGLEFDRLQAMAAELNGAGSGDAVGAGTAAPRAMACEADVTDTVALDLAVAKTLEAFGVIDIVVANAGIANNGNFESTHVEDLARVVNVNLIGAIRTMKSTYAALKASRGYALIVSSASAFPALPGITAYGASKAGVDHFANNLRLEMKSAGVDIGVAYPSWVDTDLVRDQQQELPYFRKALSMDPFFFGRVTSLQECVAILAQGIELRSRRLYVPEFVSVMHAARSLMVSKWWEFAIGLFANRMLPEMNAEARDLGRSFGKTSVETTRR